VYYLPATTNPFNNTVLRETQLQLMVCDLRDKHEFEIMIPFQSSTPRKRVTSANTSPRYLGHDFALADVNTGSFDIHSVTGRVRIISLMQLDASGGAVIPIQLVCSLRAGPDFTLYEPHPPGFAQANNTYPLVTTVATALPTVEAQSNLEALSVRDSLSDPSSIQISDEPTVPQLASGMGINDEMDLKVLLSRLYPQASADFPSSLPAGYYLSNIPATPGNDIPQNLGGIQLPEDVFSHFIKLFVYWNGGVKFMISSNADNTNPILGQAVHKYDFSIAPSLTTAMEFAQIPVQTGFTTANDFNSFSFSGQLFNLSNQKFAAISAPYKSIYRQLFIRKSGFPSPVFRDSNPLAFTTGSVSTVIELPDATRRPDTLTLTLWKGLADDCRLSYLVAPPTVRYASLNLIPPPT